jgi:hypothetical protein
MKKSVSVIFLFLISAFLSFAQPAKTLLVCGDSKVLMVDYSKSKDSIPHIVWTWDAHAAKDLPELYRIKMFNTMDDCKPVNKGKQILVSASSGAIALLNTSDRKVLFYATVPNAHSIALLPGNIVATAASTARDGNKIMLFDMAQPEKAVYTDSLYSAHGVVWNEKTKSLFALGYQVLREYKLVAKSRLELKREWKIPGIGGHELQPTADGKNLFVTEHNGAWIFDLSSYSFKKIEGFPDAENIKSLGQSPSGQYIYTIPEQSWWTFHVRFFQPAGSLAFPDLHVYKARWFEAH